MSQKFITIKKAWESPARWFLFLFSFILLSCSDDSGIDGPVDMQLWDIVTYAGRQSDTGGSVFTFRQVDDSPEIVLTSDKVLPDDVETGTRLMIRYIPESGEAYKSGPVNLLGASRINQGVAETEWKDDYGNWNRDKVFLYSMWRTGTYLNFHLRLTYSAEPRIFTLVLDPDTKDSDMPELYLVHIMAKETDSHDRAYFASFDIGRIWSDPAVRGVKIHVANMNLDKPYFEFFKTN